MLSEIVMASGVGWESGDRNFPGIPAFFQPFSKYKERGVGNSREISGNSVLPFAGN